MRGSSLIAHGARSSWTFILGVILLPGLWWVDIIITIIEISVSIVWVLWISIFRVDLFIILVHALVNLPHLLYSHLSCIIIFLLCDKLLCLFHIQLFFLLVGYHLLLGFEAGQESVEAGALLSRSECASDLAEFSGSCTFRLLGEDLDVLALLLFGHGLLHSICLLDRLETLYLTLRSRLRGSNHATRCFIICDPRSKL